MYYVFISVIETSLLKRLAIPLFSLFFLLLILVPIIGVRKGAKDEFQFFRLQPIEPLKPFFILATVQILSLGKFQNSQVKYF